MLENKYKIYGRTRGRSNKRINLDKYYKTLEKFKLNKLSTKEKNYLDIGSGYGEISIYLSNKFKNAKIISCDKYIDGNLNLIRFLKKNKFKNSYIFHGNIHQLLDINSTQEYFDAIYIFFPDPWPKKKHNKRRLINKAFLEKIYFFLKSNSNVFIVTDSADYLRKILASIYDLKNKYILQNQSTLYLDYNYYQIPVTKFYQKAIISSRIPTFLILKKI